MCCAELLSCVRLFVIPWTVASPDSSGHGDSPGKNTGVGCHALLQGIFLTQGLNPTLPHCRWILYQPSYQGSPLSSRGHPYSWFMTPFLHLQSQQHNTSLALFPCHFSFSASLQSPSFTFTDPCDYTGHT